LKAIKNYPGIFITLVSISLLITACNKKPDQVGLGLQPTTAELSVIFDNSTGLFSHSIVEDSVRTDANVIQTGMIGSLMDPVFGRTTSEIFSQFRLSENGQNFGTNPILDSLVLSFQYLGLYGDSMSSQTIRVYELDEDMNPDTSYYSHQTISDDGVEIGELTFIPQPGDSVNVGGEMQAPQLRIRLSDEFAQKIINADESEFEDNEAWLEFMQGLRITADHASTDGGIISFDMFAPHTALTIYYKTGDPQDTLSYTFLSNNNCARFSSYDHNEYLNASSFFQAQVTNGDTSLGNNLFYLQSMGGVKAQIRLPDIHEFFAEGPVAINEAKLIFNVYDDGEELVGPPQLGLAKIDEEGNYILLPDATEASSYYGGYLNEGKTQYFFRISRHVQQVLTGQSPNYPLVVLISGASFRPNRVILYGSDSISNDDLKMTLAIKYTQVN